MKNIDIIQQYIQKIRDLGIIPKGIVIKDEYEREIFTKEELKKSENLEDHFQMIVINSNKIENNFQVII